MLSQCGSLWFLLTKAMPSFMFVQTSFWTNSWDATESKTHECQIMPLIDDITGPVCGETTGHRRIPVARDHWSGASVVQCVAIPTPLDSPHKSRYSARLTSKTITSQIYWKSNRTYQIQKASIRPVGYKDHMWPWCAELDLKNRR